MKAANKNRTSTRTLVLGAILTALVVILQYLGQFIRLGPFSISLVLIPIVIGAAACGTAVSGWLGFVFGVVVLITDAAAFLAVSIPGTILTVLAKGIACGLAAGIVFRLLEKKNKYLATIAAAVVCPIVNTGIFALGCRIFFWDTLRVWGEGLGFENAFAYMIFGMIGANFLVEMASNIVLSPAVVRLLGMVRKK